MSSRRVADVGADAAPPPRAARAARKGDADDPGPRAVARPAGGRPRRRGAVVLLLVCLAALVGLVVAAAVDRRDLAFTTGVPILGLAAELAPGQTACQRYVSVEEPFRAVRLVPHGIGGPTPALALALREPASGRSLAHAAVAAGYPDGAPLIVKVARVPAGGRIDVCVTDRGQSDLGLDGGKAESVPQSPLIVAGGRSAQSALALDFLRGQPRSVLSQVPLILSRAALFRPGWVGTWTFWLLAVLVAVGVPAALAVALAQSDREAAGGDV